MEKRIGILFALFLLISCSDSKSDEAPIVHTYGVTIKTACPGSHFLNTYCISKSEYDKINSGIQTVSCNYVAFRDSDNKLVTGYFVSSSSPCSK